MAGCPSKRKTESSVDDRVLLQGFYWESYRHGHVDPFPEIYSKVAS